MVRARLCCVLSDLARYREALAALEQAQRLDPGNSMTLQRIGMVLHGLGKPSDAENYFRQVLEVAPGDLRTQVLLANTLRDQGDVGSRNE